MVRPRVAVSRVSVAAAALVAPRRAVRLAACATEEKLVGIERSRSMTWTTPPLKMRSCAHASQNVNDGQVEQDFRRADPQIG